VEEPDLFEIITKPSFLIIYYFETYIHSHTNHIYDEHIICIRKITFIFLLCKIHFAYNEFNRNIKIIIITKYVL